MDTLHEYEQKKAYLVRQLKEINRLGETISLSKSYSNLFRDRRKSSAKRLDFKSLNQVIRIDKQNAVAEVEAATTYEDFTKETLRSGFMPAVVPQLATITVGGAVAGGGAEASSFRFGLVHDTIREMEILLSSGTVVTATRTNKYRDLFLGTINTFGTIGYILKLKVQLIKVLPYVKLRHFRFTNSKHYFSAIDEVSKTRKYKNERVDFIDGMILSSNKQYLMLATLSDSAPYTSNYTYMRRYYQSISKRTVDYLTIRDFIWRWDPDWFWTSKNFGMENQLVRFVFGKFLLHSKSYWKIVGLDRKYQLMSTLDKVLGKRRALEDVIQDVQIPLKEGEKFLIFFLKTIAIRPIWICPVQAYHKKTVYPFYPLDTKKVFVNFGFWDFVPAKKSDPHHFNRLIETVVSRLGGIKALYSESFYTEKEFWTIYDKNAYDKLKKKYDSAQRLKDLYEKCVLRG